MYSQLQAVFMTKYIRRASGSNFWCEKHTHPNQTKRETRVGARLVGSVPQIDAQPRKQSRGRPGDDSSVFLGAAGGCCSAAFVLLLNHLVACSICGRGCPRQSALHRTNEIHLESKPPLLIFRISDLSLLLLFLLLLFLWYLSCCVVYLCIIRCTGPSIDTPIQKPSSVPRVTQRRKKDKTKTINRVVRWESVSCLRPELFCHGCGGIRHFPLVPWIVPLFVPSPSLSSRARRPPSPPRSAIVPVAVFILPAACRLDDDDAGKGLSSP